MKKEKKVQHPEQEIDSPFQRFEKVAKKIVTTPKQQKNKKKS